MAVALFALMWLPPVVAQAPPQEPTPSGLEKKVEPWLGRQALGVYMLGKKVGFVIAEVKVVSFEGKPAFHLAVESELQIKMFGEVAKMKTVQETWNSLEGRGALLQVREMSIEDGTKTENILRQGDAGWEVVTRTGDREEVREVDPPRASLEDDIKIDAWLAAGPEKGEKHELWMTDLGKKDINARESLQFIRSEEHVQSGVTGTVHVVKMKMDGLSGTVKLLNQKVFLEAEVGRVMRMVAEEEAIARRMDVKAIDLTADFSVALDEDLGDDPAQLESLTAEISGLGDMEFPDSHRQRIEKREGKPDLVHLKRDYQVEEGKPLSDEERKPWVEKQPGIESDHPRIRAQAEKIIGGETDPIKMAARLQNWTFNHLETTMAKNSNSALTILDQKAGDCTEHARLFVALARAAGLPAREVGGLMYIHEGKPMFGWHAWAEIHDGRQWVSIDPAWDQVFVDATHLKLSSGTDDYSWVGTIGALKLRVTGFEKKD